MITLAYQTKHTSFIGDNAGNFVIGTESHVGFNSMDLRTGMVYNSNDPLSTGITLIRLNGATLSFPQFNSAGILHNDATGLLSSSAINLASSDVSGTLPIANGGTGQTTASTAYNALSPSMYQVASIQGTLTVTAAKANAGDILITPIYIPAKISVSRMTVYVSTPLGATGDVGVYDNTGTLVLDGGANTLTTAVGLKSITPIGAPITLNPGQYYVAVTWNSITGIIFGANLGAAAAGAVKRTGVITGGGTTLPGSITLTSITDGRYLYFVGLDGN
jgi:hypothetical protein